MSTNYGPQNLPYPQPSDAPDGPGAFLALLQKMSVGGVTPYTTYASLPATGFLGQLVTVTSDSNAAYNGVYWWNGSGWKILNAPNIVRNYRQDIADAAFANTAQIGSAVAFPALTTASRILLRVSGFIGNSGTAGADYGVAYGATAGTVVDSAQASSFFRVQCAAAAKYYAYVHEAYIDMPASTAVSLFMNMNTPSTAGHFTGQFSAQVLLPGEY